MWGGPLQGRLTRTSGSATFDVDFGPVKNGSAQSAVFGGISSGDCATSAVAIKQ